MATRHKKIKVIQKERFLFDVWIDEEFVRDLLALDFVADHAKARSFDCHRVRIDPRYIHDDHESEGVAAIIAVIEALADKKETK